MPPSTSPPPPAASRTGHGSPPSTGTTAAVVVEGLTRTFGRGASAHRALDDVSFAIGTGECVALIGASGSGKSTLLRHLNGLLVGDRGRVEVLGRTVQDRGRPAAGVRDLRTRIGFVFQQFNLVGRLSLLDNVRAGMLGRIPTWRSLLRRWTGAETRTAMRALDRVELAAFAGRRAGSLSGGQQQRGALARVIAQGAELILADEPIASLDPRAVHRVMGMLRALHREDGRTVVVTLHQVDVARQYCDRAIALRDGRVVFDGPTTGLTSDRLERLYAAGHECEDP